LINTEVKSTMETRKTEIR